jgi:uncharacterized protein (DUF427 family)
MVYQATWNGKVIAEADEAETIMIEGNRYFPPKAVAAAIDSGMMKHSEYHSTCVWKGLANYYHINVNGQENQDSAWYYPEPKAGSREIVGKDFANYVAFWRGVEVKPQLEASSKPAKLPKVA